MKLISLTGDGVARRGAKVEGGEEEMGFTGSSQQRGERVSGGF